MPFVHPIVFWAGAGAVSVPVIIHLLNRRRFRTRDWAAMRFLLESLRQNRRRLRIEELILLAVRCLVVFLLALAAGRLVGCTALEALPLGGAETETAVFILDDSYSMGQRTPGGNLHTFVAAEIVEQIERLPKGARVAIVRTSGAASGGPPALKAITDVASVETYLKAQRLSDRRADLAEAVKSAGRLLKEEPGAKRVYVLSDFRRLDVAEPARRDALRKAFESLADDRVAVVAADYGRVAEDNLTVEGVELLQAEPGRADVVLAGREIAVGVTVRNRGPVPARDVEIALRTEFAVDAEAGRAGSGELRKTIPEIPSGQSLRARFIVSVASAGPAVLKGELVGEDELPGDDRSLLALNVREAIRVLLVADMPSSSGGRRDETLYLMPALDPRGDGLYGVRPVLAATRQLPDLDLDAFDAAILLNVSEFPVGSDAEGTPVAPAVEAIERFVREGGGLAVFTGDRVEPTFYNRFLYAGGQGLLPLPVGSPKSATDLRDPFHLHLVDDAPARSAAGNLMRFAEVTRSAGVSVGDLLSFYTYTPARESASAGPVVLARFTDAERSPAVILKRLGAGEVVLYCTTANTQWTDWQRVKDGDFFAVAVNDLVRHLARGQPAGRNGPVGTPVAWRVPAALRDGRGALRRLHDAQPQHEWPVAGEWIRHEDLWRAGAYVVSVTASGGREAAAVFARNADPAEGDLTPGGRSAVEAVAPEGFLYTRRNPDGNPQALWTRPRKEYWVWALAAMLAMVGLETVLAQRFGHYERIP